MSISMYRNTHTHWSFDDISTQSYIYQNQQVHKTPTDIYTHTQIQPTTRI